MKIYIVDMEFGFAVFEADVAKETPTMYKIKNVTTLFSSGTLDGAVFSNAIQKETWKRKTFKSLNEAVAFSVAQKELAIKRAKEAIVKDEEALEALRNLRED